MSSLLSILLHELHKYGYPILWLIIFMAAVGLPLPASLVLLAAGAFAAHGDFNIALLMGIYWVAHHNTFHYIQRSDRNLLWLNILLLLCIVFLPFPTALLGQYPEQQVPVIIYAGTLVITGLVLQALWWYATSRYRLVDRNIGPRLVQRATRRNLTAPLVYLLAIGISMFSVPASLVLFLLVPVYYILPGRIDRHWAQRSTSRSDEARVSPDGDAGLSGGEASHLRKASPEER
jgi:transmembrane protein TMEM174 (potassium channel)